MGVTKGFEKAMTLNGIGYRVQLKGRNLEFQLGYSHPILYECPEGITFKVEAQNKFVVSGIDKQLVGHRVMTLSITYCLPFCSTKFFTSD